MMNMLIIRDRLATLTQCIKSLQISKVDSRNKSQSDRDLNFESRSKLTKQRNHRDDIMSSRAD